jgi:SAM-dependent methyltransferase
MYDAFSSDYDRFVDWPGRLAAEMPYIEQELQAAKAHRVLDAACGTGMHAIALAQQGYTVVGTDLSAGMIEQAQANATARGVGTRFEVAGFGVLSAQVGTDFDAVLCLGNSLPHLLTPADLVATLADFGACLQSGGMLLIQNRNFDAVLAHDQRWMDPQAHREEQKEWLFFRFYDFEPEGLLKFNMVTLQREGANAWSQHVTSTRLRPWRQKELTAAVVAAGFDAVTYYGDMSSAPFDPEHSPNLIVVARHKS